MLDQPPGVVPEEEELPAAAEPAEIPPPPPPVAEPPPPPPEAPGPSPVQLQAAQAEHQFNAARATLNQQYQVLDATERQAQAQLQPLIDQIRQGLISPEQAAPILERANADRQARLAKAEQIQAAANELQDVERRVGYELAEQHRRITLEPVAKHMAIQGLVDEAAQKSGDPEGFNKTRLKRNLEKTPPDAWRAIQEAAVEDHRDQRLTQRAAAGTDEMGGTGTSGVLREDASSEENIMAGLRQHYGSRAPRT